MLIKDEMSDEQLNAFITYIEENEMLKAPKNLKEKIIQESRNKEVQIQEPRKITAPKTKKISAKAQFFLYSLKISAAVVAAVFLLAFIDTDTTPVFSMPKQNMERKTIVSILNEKSNEWSGKLNQFSNMLY
ncbi:MAG: hypothetical protein NC412_14020 [Roseburia sp.]|nr:hypothetical protein [Roseburia sp.]MCM1279852.1 hypothetical protein [Robinsoniella sp.]